MLCTALFSGHGYSESFAEGMTALIADLRREEKITVQTGADQLCAVCPNLTGNGGCALGTEDVLRRDMAALEVLKLAPGDELTWQQAKNRLAGLTEQSFQAVCGDCRWQKEGLCSLSLLQERVK